MRDDDQQYYDDYDDIDDEYPDPAEGPYVGDAETLLRRSIDIIATAPTMPLSSSPRIDRDEIIELLEEALSRLPDELRQARWMLKERQEFVTKTRREADEILEAARVRAERMVQRTEVVRAAEQRARQVMETAETDSRRLQHETEDFLDQRLGSFEILLDKLQKTVAAGRQRLSIGVIAHNTGGDRARRPQQGLLRPGPLTWADLRCSSTPSNCCASPARTATCRCRSRRPRSTSPTPPWSARSTSRSTSTPRSTTSSCRAPSPSPGTVPAAAASRRSTRCSRRRPRALHRRPRRRRCVRHRARPDRPCRHGPRGGAARPRRRAPVPRRLPRAVSAVRARPRRRAVLVHGDRGRRALGGARPTARLTDRPLVAFAARRR